MAQAPHPAGTGGANFVRQIVADPKNVPDVMLLYGYLGASSEEGHERLYLSPDLSNYVEVPTASILHRAEAAKEQDPNGGVTLWVKKDAALKYKMAPARQAAQQAMAYYFAGAIQAGAAAAAAPVPPRPTLPQQCGPQTIIEAACPQSVGPCPTGFATCAVTCAPQRCTQPTPCAGASCGPECTIGCTNVVNCPTGAVCPTFYPCTHFLCPTHGATCATCLGHPSCGPCTRAPPCTMQPPCPTYYQTCPGLATCGPPCQTFPHEQTCAPRCTLGAGCRPTVNRPECPFPTEICTHVPAQCTRLPNCPHPQAAQAGMGAEAQVGCAAGTIHASLQIVCSVACPTRFTCNPACWVTRYVTCNPQCWVTRYAPECCLTIYETCNPTRACPIETAACPIQSLACPSLACPSLACGSFGCGGPVQM